MQNDSPSIKRHWLRRTFKFISCCATLVMALLYSNAARAQTYHVTLTCSSTDTLVLQPVLVGDTVQDTVFFTNRLRRPSDITWTFHGLTTQFQFPDSVVSSVAIGDSIRLIASVAPSVIASLEVPLTISVTGDDSCTLALDVFVQGIGPSANGATFSLQHANEEAIAIRSTSDTASRYFYFRNDSSAALVLDTIFIEQAPSFSIDTLPRFPLTIAAHDSFPLTITFHTTSTGSGNGYLVSKPNHSPISDEIKISLQGLRVALGSVSSLPADSSFIWLFPNPARGPVTIHTEGLSHAHATISDVLGRTFRESSFNSDWQWDRRTDGGVMAPAGTYFLIVTGTRSNGEAVQQVERVVLE